MLYLIDASIYIFRYYFSLPQQWHSLEGYPTEAVYGYLNFLLKLLEQQSPHYIAAAYDESLHNCFRNDIYPEYKANRALPDEALAFQLAACIEGAQLLGIFGVKSNRYEADDLIGTLALQWRQQSLKETAVTIISRDKDLGQLVTMQDQLWDYGYSEPRGIAELQMDLGIKPDQLPDYLALVGDKIDNIPGVPGIGKKTAIALLSNYASVEALLDAGDSLARLAIRGAGKLSTRLRDHQQQIAISKQLATICCTAPINHDRYIPITNNMPITNDIPIAKLVARQAINVKQFEDFVSQMGLGKTLVDRAKRLIKA